MGTFDKAKAKTTAKPKKKWWIINTSRYSYYIWALPFIPFLELSGKIRDYNRKRRVWNEKKATKVLDYVLPQVLEWVKEDNAFYYSMDWGTSALWRKARRRDRKWADKFEYHLRDFLKDGYENADYIKTIEKDNYGDTWVKFVEKPIDK